MRMEKKLTEIDAVLPGAVLAEDVVDGAGSVLLPGGSILSDTSLAGLHRRGIAQLCLSVPVSLDEAEMAAAVARTESRLDHLFRDAGESEAASDMKLRLLSYRRSRL